MVHIGCRIGVGITSPIWKYQHARHVYCHESNQIAPLDDLWERLRAVRGGVPDPDPDPEPEPAKSRARALTYYGIKRLRDPLNVRID